MSGITDLKLLLSTLNPVLADGEFVFLTQSGQERDAASALNPIATFQETEGLSLIVSRIEAQDAGQAYQGVYRMITLQVHSSLEAVGLTAAVAEKLAEKGISANVVAAFHHDHVFVPTEKADAAISALQELQELQELQTSETKHRNS